jgi:two-component system response regulator YesN
MLKVIIADDEERVCRLVQMIVDWDSLGMQVIGTAANGIKALELVKNLVPDILITDIRMPGCDGLELIEKAKAISPRLQIALISGYAQFEYARTAIEFNVGGYILKPIKKEIITATLEKLGNACREHARLASASKQLLQDSHKSSKLLQSRLLEDLAGSRVNELSYELLESKYGYIASDGLLQVFIVKIDCSFELINDPSMIIIKNKAEEIFGSTVTPLCDSFVFKMDLPAGYGILNFRTGNQDKIRRALREFLNQLEAHRLGGTEFSLAIGKAANSAGMLPASMQDAKIALAERLLEGTGRLLEAGTKEAQPDSRRLVEKYARAAERVADMLSEEEADNVAGDLTDDIKSAGLSGYAIMDLIVSVGKMFALRLSMDEGAAFLRDFEEKCELCGSVSKLLDYLRRFLKDQIRAVRDKFESEAIRPIRIAKKYVMQHFSEPITLDDVCSATGFSISYFSKLFKKETGEGFSRYLSRVRIDKARELLRDTDLPVAEICGLVGYSDIKHFTGTFRKLTSLNPGQYRKLYG